MPMFRHHSKIRYTLPRFSYMFQYQLSLLVIYGVFTCTFCRKCRQPKTDRHARNCLWHDIEVADDVDIWIEAGITLTTTITLNALNLKTKISISFANIKVSISLIFPQIHDPYKNNRWVSQGCSLYLRHSSVLYIPVVLQHNIIHIRYVKNALCDNNL